MTLVIGITGAVGAGKSTVSNLLAEKGARVIEADVVAHAVLRQGSVKARLRPLFGPTIFDSNGDIDPQGLGKAVFAGPMQLKRLTDVVYPLIRTIIDAQVEVMKKRESLPIIVDAPTLFEAGCERTVDKIITVECQPEVCEARCRQRGWADGEVRNREALKIPASERRRRAHITIENSGSLDDLKATVDKLWEDFTK